MARRMSPCSFTVALAANFPPFFIHFSPSKLPGKPPAYQWATWGSWNYDIICSEELWSSKSINHRFALQRERVNYCTCQSCRGPTENLEAFIKLRFALNEDLWLDSWFDLREGMMWWNNWASNRPDVLSPGLMVVSIETIWSELCLLQILHLLSWTGGEASVFPPCPAVVLDVESHRNAGNIRKKPHERLQKILLFCTSKCHTEAVFCVLCFGARQLKVPCVKQCLNVVKLIFTGDIKTPLSDWNLLLLICSGVSGWSETWHSCSQVLCSRQKPKDSKGKRHNWMIIYFLLPCCSPRPLITFQNQMRATGVLAGGLRPIIDSLTYLNVFSTLWPLRSPEYFEHSWCKVDDLLHYLNFWGTVQQFCSHWPFWYQWAIPVWNRKSSRDELGIHLCREAGALQWSNPNCKRKKRESIKYSAVIHWTSFHWGKCFLCIVMTEFQI